MTALIVHNILSLRRVQALINVINFRKGERMFFILAAMMAMSAIAPTGDMCVPDGSGSDYDWPYVVRGNPTFGPGVEWVIMELVLQSGEVIDDFTLYSSGDDYSMDATWPISYGYMFRVRAVAYNTNNAVIGVKTTSWLTEDDFVLGWKVWEYIWSPHCVCQWAPIGI